MTLSYQRLQPRQANLLAQCIQRVYGDTYPAPEFYDADYVAGMIAGQKLFTVVALNTAGDVVAGMSTVLEAVGDHTADGSALMVDPAYRGQGIVAILGREMAEVYRATRIGGLHLYALALHDIVQKQSMAAGAVITGVLPAWFSRSARVAGYNYPDTRIGAVCLYMPLATLPDRLSYLPVRYVEVLEDIYSQLNLSRNLMRAENNLRLPQESIIRRDEKPANGQLRLLLDETGVDIATALGQQLPEARGEDFPVVYLDLALGNAGVNLAVDAAREQGFIFGALMVDRLGSDRLRMQRYDEKMASPESMVVDSVQAQRLRDFVLSDR